MNKKPLPEPEEILSGDFAKALKDGTADEAVVRALFRSATGYSHASSKIFKTKDDEELVVPYTEHYAPYLPSIVMWLANRCPAEWRNMKAAQAAMGAGGGDGDAPTIRKFGNGNGADASDA